MMEQELKKLVVFYSYEGATRAVAQAIAQEIGADLLEIKPRDELQSKGFGKYVWGGARVVMGRTPELLPMDKDVADYDLVFIGTPVWAFSMTPPIKSFLQQVSLRHKAVAIFCTHEGSIGSTFKQMRAALADSDMLGERSFAGVHKDTQIALERAQQWARDTLSATRAPSS